MLDHGGLLLDERIGHLLDNGLDDVRLDELLDDGLDYDRLDELLDDGLDDDRVRLLDERDGWHRLGRRLDAR